MTLRRLLEEPLAALTFADIEALIVAEAEEDLRLELKRELPANNGQRDGWMLGSNKIGSPAKDALAKEIVAFANAYGGVIVVGVDETEDHPKRAKGPDPVLIPRVIDLAERLHQSLDQTIDPPLASFEARGIVAPGSQDGSGVLIIRVTSSLRAPHGHGRPPLAFLRRGSRSEPMTMRDLHSSLFETRTRAERLRELRNARALRMRSLVDGYRNGTLQTEQGNYQLGGHSLGFRCTAMPIEDLSIRASSITNHVNLCRPGRDITQSNLPPALGEGPFGLNWRPRAQAMEYIEAPSDYYARWLLSDSGMMEVAGFRCSSHYQGHDFVFTPIWFVPVVAQMMALVEQVRVAASNLTAEYIIECHIVNPGKIVRSIVGSGTFESPTLIPDEEVIIGPYHLSRTEDFQAVFSEMERGIWNSLGLHVHQPTAIRVLEWLTDSGRRPA